uniref:hypothetical protein n=1 Tax=Neorhizobium sp. EC2-8 TaxID=3129230 RepID=UPI00310107B9
MVPTLNFVQEQILYRVLIADIERRHPEMVNMKDVGMGPNADELQRLLTYRLSLKALESFTEENAGGDQ